VHADEIGDRGRERGPHEHADQEADVLKNREEEPSLKAVSDREEDRDGNDEIDEIYGLSLSGGCRIMAPE
jgi:hypothetical protein